MAKADDKKRIRSTIKSDTVAATETVYMQIIHASRQIPSQEIQTKQEFEDLYRDEDRG